ncbi:MAG: PDDEXK nuclease domain-containing protein [Bacteroidetes bacterium]|nr:PDDEXK nuclease domain-containing protein [Bacteroidota bacterium]
MKILTQHNFNELVNQIYQTHEAMKGYALKAVNVSLTLRNWLFGFYIVEYEQNGADRAKYGENLIDELYKSLAEKGLKGVVPTSLRLCRSFYVAYPQIQPTVSVELQARGMKQIQQTLSVELQSFDNENNIIQQTLSVELQQKFGTVSQELQNTENQSFVNPIKLLTNLSFSHFSELLKIDEPLKRAFYEIECIKGTWSVRELRRQINSLFYERTGISKKPEKLIERVQNSAEKQNFEDVVKSPFVFELLGLKARDVVLESDLEQAIMDNLQNFLLEFGTGFCFEARQKRILIEDEYFPIDLVFYHRILHCHVLIEIKIDEFKHKYIGQLNAYLEHYKRHEMHEGDNPPVGILLVTNKNSTLIEYAKGSMDNQLFVSKYLLELPNKEDLFKIIEKEYRNI